MGDDTPGPGRLRRILRWVPLVSLAVVQAVAWGALLSGGMTGVRAWVALISLVPLLGGAALLTTGAYALWRRRFSRPMAGTLAASLIALWPGAWLFGVGQMAYPASLANTTPTATVRLPSDAPLRVLWGSDRLATNRHAFTPDQRWAYDLIVEPGLNGSSRLEDYGCWETAVLAPASALVHLAHDGEPDAEPGHLSPNMQAPLGNHVVLKLETGTFLILAHLRRGSVAVFEGDDVTEGQLLGRCGNSGNTSEPHIHIHHQRQDPATYPVNFAEGLPLFFRGHDGPPMPEGGLRMEGERPVATGAVVQHRGAASAGE